MYRKFVFNSAEHDCAYGFEIAHGEDDMGPVVPSNAADGHWWRDYEAMGEWFGPFETWDAACDDVMRHSGVWMPAEVATMMGIRHGATINVRSVKPMEFEPSKWMYCACRVGLLPRATPSSNTPHSGRFAMSSTPMQRAVWTYIIAAALAFWLLACGGRTCGACG